MLPSQVNNNIYQYIKDEFVNCEFTYDIAHNPLLRAVFLYNRTMLLYNTNNCVI